LALDLRKNPLVGIKSLMSTAKKKVKNEIKDGKRMVTNRTLRVGNVKDKVSLCLFDP